MMPVHPAAELFPEMTDAEFSELVDDIRENGLHDAIVCTPHREILDGRHRYRACTELGIEPTFRTYEGEPWRYVISTNLHRRHLTDTQRAMIAAQVAGRTRGQYTRTANGSGEPDQQPPTHEQARDMLRVSESAVKRARQVHKTGTDKLKAAVDDGTVTLSAGSALARSAPEEQDAAVVELATRRQPEPPAEDTADTAPKPRQRPRKPLGQAALEAGWTLRKSVDRTRNIAEDHRFSDNKDQVTRALRSHLVHAVDTANTVLSMLPVIDPNTGELRND